MIAKSRSRRISGKVIMHVVLILIGITFILPFLVMLSTSVKSDAEAFDTSFHLIPKVWHFDNYSNAFKTIPYLRYTLNTLLITVLSVVGELFACPLVSYSISKIKWAGSKPIFAIILATMLIPYQVTMIPVYIIWNRLGLMNTYAPLIIPQFFGSAFYIIIMTQFLKTLPNSLIDAAKIDGASEFSTYSRIILPLLKTPMATVAIFTFLASWSDFLGPLLYINDQNAWTLSLGLQQFMSAHAVQWGQLMAASVMFTIPSVLLFFFAQQYFVEGIVTTGIKG